MASLWTTFQAPLFLRGQSVKSKLRWASKFHLSKFTIISIFDMALLNIQDIKVEFSQNVLYIMLNDYV